MTLTEKSTFAIELCRAAGEKAQAYFNDRSNLTIDQKGAQDWVSNADRNVELLIRDKIAQAYPEDGIVGEEHDTVESQNGFVWVIDPIDGTTNFVNGIPHWVIVLAGVAEGQTQIGVIHDPIHNETFAAVRGGGAFLNGAPMQVAKGKALSDGTISVGYSNRLNAGRTIELISGLLAQGALFYRNASGALSLAYVASGRLLGYVEEHMNAWDCIAGQLLVAEAGGRIEEQNADAMIRDGGRVIASAPDVFEDLQEIAQSVWPS